MRNIVVINKTALWNFHIEGVDVVPAKEYLLNPHYAEIRNIRVFNLSTSYAYQSAGYYVSLLAEARGHKAFPNVATIQDFAFKTMTRVIPSEIDELIQTSLSRLKSNDFVLSIYFGKNVAKQYEKLSRKLYNLFPSPLLRACFVFNKKWILQQIAPLSLNEISETHRDYVVHFAKEYFSRKKFRPLKETKYIYDLGILVKPNDPVPPSNRKALQNFIEASRKIGFNTELITKDDYSKIPEFDALFIRETTAVNHHTYRFSRRAYKEGLVVIDDHWSILRCTNKVYLAELLDRQHIPIPKTLIIHKSNLSRIETELGLPCILKQPDSSFSQGIVKVDNKKTLKETMDSLTKNSDLLIAQKFIPTPFDWRIGILDKKPLYACKYFMANGHWQIYNWNETKKSECTGSCETLPIEEAPEKVVSTALKAAALIGDGFYGVDLKQMGNKVFVIEVNDNPSIDSGVEDIILKEKLYLTIMQSLLNRLRAKNQ